MNLWCEAQLMPSRQIAADTAGWRTRGADFCSVTSAVSARLSPSFPSASTASSCKGPSRRATSRIEAKA